MPTVTSLSLPGPPNEPRYGRAKLKEGEKYERFVHRRLSPWGITFWVNQLPLFQMKHGESLQGCEVKLDRRCTETGRLSIEVAEKSHRSMPSWTPSGIDKNDNSWAYIQGNYEMIIVFSKKMLLHYRQQKIPPIEESHGTVRKFYLPMTVALTYCILAIDGHGRRVS